MPLKKADILSRADFDEAVVHLRLNVSEVSKTTGIPRAYLSEFRNGDRKLRPEQQAKLRDFFEEKGVQFDDAAPQPDHDNPGAAPGSTPIAAVPVRTVHPVAVAVSDDVFDEVKNRIAANDGLIAKALATKIKRVTFVGTLVHDQAEGELTSEARAEYEKVRDLLVENYVLVRMLRGWRALSRKPDDTESETLRDVLFESVREGLETTGLSKSGPSQPTETPEPGAGADGEAETEDAPA